MFSLCHYFHHQLFRLILQRATWSFSGYLQCNRVLHSWRKLEPQADSLISSVQLNINCYVNQPRYKDLTRAFLRVRNVQNLYIRFLPHPQGVLLPVRYADELQSTIKKISETCWRMVSDDGPAKERPQAVQVEGLRDERLCRLIENRLMRIKNDEEIIEAVSSCQNDSLKRFVSGSPRSEI